MPRLALMPMLLAFANPTFELTSITVSFGHRRAAAALPSVDALSTTTMSWGAAGGAACSDSRQRSRSARALNETMMIEIKVNSERLFSRT